MLPGWTLGSIAECSFLSPIPEWPQQFAPLLAAECPMLNVVEHVTLGLLRKSLQKRSVIKFAHTAPQALLWNRGASSLNLNPNPHKCTPTHGATQQWGGAMRIEQWGQWSPQAAPASAHQPEPQPSPSETMHHFHRTNASARLSHTGANPLCLAPTQRAPLSRTSAQARIPDSGLRAVRPPLWDVAPT